ncbi:unnamed protein product [Ilex paraguariensis]|uniref:Uncharacterized protein n=1 Tax=Ilex paraguariensis TaxID=185542 RepID=A0ABC8RGM1_9AQUA
MNLGDQGAMQAPLGADLSGPSDQRGKKRADLGDLSAQADVLGALAEQGDTLGEPAALGSPLKE